MHNRMIYTLVRGLRFKLGDDLSDIVLRLTSMTCAYIRNKFDKGPQLPLRVSLVAEMN